MKPSLRFSTAKSGFKDWQTELEAPNAAFTAAYLLRTQQLGAVSKDKLIAKRLEAKESFYKLRNFIDSYYTINEGAEPYVMKPL